MKQKKLTQQEQWIIVHKGTEAPFSGQYTNHFGTGTYCCRRCGTALFTSEAKFDSHCGWPAFDEALTGKVEQLPDVDGVRTEIVCGTCRAHLGHVFFDEGLTDKNVRHCVNSLSLEFEPVVLPMEVAFFAGGCFWGVEHLLGEIDGVISVESGYMGGPSSPSYEEVCTGRTGHAETVRVTFDPRDTTFEALARRFFEIHDPTQEGGQGPDIGDQYRSAVFTTTDVQRQITEALVAELQSNGYRVVTRIEPAGEFWKAEEYHQGYYRRTGKRPYVRVRRFSG